MAVSGTWMIGDEEGLGVQRWTETMRTVVFDRRSTSGVTLE
ncbi:MAG: hypothetical protein WD020_07535 [Acidimicrobiia bacterium]